MSAAFRVDRVCADSIVATLLAMPWIFWSDSAMQAALATCMPTSVMWLYQTLQGCLDAKQQCSFNSNNKVTKCVLFQVLHQPGNYC